LLLGPAQFLLVTSYDNHFGTSLNKYFGNAETKSAATSGNHGTLAVYSECTHHIQIVLAMQRYKYSMMIASKSW
jgi:hypothetical protein